MTYTTEQLIEAIKWHFAVRNDKEPWDITVTLTEKNDKDLICRVQHGKVDKMVALPIGYVEKLTDYLYRNEYI